MLPEAILNLLRESDYRYAKQMRENVAFNLAQFERELCELCNKSASDEVFIGRNIRRGFRL